jgi:hypothetical protein
VTGEDVGAFESVLEQIPELARGMNSRASGATTPRRLQQGRAGDLLLRFANLVTRQHGNDQRHNEHHVQLATDCDTLCRHSVLTYVRTIDLSNGKRRKPISYDVVSEGRPMMPAPQHRCPAA